MPWPFNELSRLLFTFYLFVNCLSEWKLCRQMLQWMDALDPWENVTDLGRLLLELPVEPRLGKMLLTATVLRCLDPVLSIVCCLSYRDPFILPADTQEKKLSAARKLELTGGSLSDHMAILRAFTLWTGARRRGRLKNANWLEKAAISSNKRL
jgi:HrpA-like RNA helicase